MLAALFLSVLIAPGLSAGSAFSKIVVFGDSLNDYGNMLQFTNDAFPNAPMYVAGRQSNGSLWVEYLAAQLGMAGQMSNYAVVGALTKPTAGFPSGNVWEPVFPGLLNGTDVATQISDYLAESNGVADPRALHILEGGANDFTRAEPATTIANLVESFVRLQQAGAKHVLVVNLPDIGLTPRVQLGAPASTAHLSGVFGYLNQALGQAIAATTLPGVSVTVLNLYQFMNKVSANPSAYGITETVLPYFYFGSGADASTWLYWDDLHPTTRGHEILADDAIASLIATYSPRDEHGNANAGVRGLPGFVRRAEGP